MAKITTEMNMPIISAPAMGVVGDVAASVKEPESFDDLDGYTISSPTCDYDPSTITVYSNSITPVQAGGTDEETACFDVVFSVGIMCDGISKTYQMVKRIGIDKRKIAQEAACSVPVSVVEANSSAVMEAAATAKRFRRLAGLE